MTAAEFRALARKAARRYRWHDRFGRHFAASKLTHDPAFEHLLRTGLVPDGAAVLDLGCGQGVLAALLHTAGRDVSHLRGIDLSASDIKRARTTGTGATFVAGDIRTEPFGRADCVVILDVLHYIDFAAQETVLARVRECLAGGGLLLLRVADASRSWRFRMTLAIDRFAMATRGHWPGRLCCRPLAEWIRMLEGLGFKVEAVPMSRGTPFANVLLVARYDPRVPRE